MLYNINNEAVYSNFPTITYAHRSLLAFLYPECSLLFHHCDELESYIVNCCVEATVHDGDCCLVHCDTELAGRRASALTQGISAFTVRAVGSTLTL